MTCEIDIVWFKEKHPTWKTKLIMWAMGTEYSHVGMLGVNDDGQEYLFHAVGEGVCVQPSHEYVNEERTIVRRKRVPLQCSMRELRGFVIGESGKDYSETNLLLIAALDYFKVKRIVDAMNWLLGDGDAERTCGELTAKVLWLWSDDYLLTGTIDNITPKDLEDILQPEVLC